VTFEVPTASEIEKLMSVLIPMLPEGLVEVFTGVINAPMAVMNDGFIPRVSSTGPGSDTSDKIVEALAAALHAFRANPTPVITTDDIVRLLNKFQKVYEGASQ
jgi:hypothetical protein